MPGPSYRSALSLHCGCRTSRGLVRAWLAFQTLVARFPIQVALGPHRCSPGGPSGFEVTAPRRTRPALRCPRRRAGRPAVQLVSAPPASGAPQVPAGASAGTAPPLWMVRDSGFRCKKQTRLRTPMAGAFASAKTLRRRIHVYSQGSHKAAANCGQRRQPEWRLCFPPRPEWVGELASLRHRRRKMLPSCRYRPEPKTLPAD